MVIVMYIFCLVFLGKDENRMYMYFEVFGYIFLGVVDVKLISFYFDEIIYDELEYGYSKLKGRYFRLGFKMYGFGYGGYGCGKFVGGRWFKFE